MSGSTTLTVLQFVYVLEDALCERYIGYTNNLRRRIEQHRKGLVRSARSMQSLSLIYCEVCLSVVDARRREKYLKTTGGRRFLAKRLQHYYLK